MSRKLFVGVDVSKGYADFEVVNEAGSVLPSCGRHDDTREGHDEVTVLLRELTGRHPEAEVVVGMECTGGYERNWVALFCGLKSVRLVSAVHRLNPLAVKKYHERELHRTITDRISAKGIAQYLWKGLRRQDLQWQEDGLEDAVTLYRTARGMVQLQANLQNKVKALLSRAYPELVCHVRHGMDEWEITLLLHYPTAADMAAAEPAEVAKIPYVTLEMAKELVRRARRSVASQTGKATGTAIRALAEEIRHLRQMIEKIRKDLEEQLKDDPGVRIIDSVKGIGIWTAICLRLEIGDVHRFLLPEHLVAFMGLDPENHQSGDEVKQKGISHRGRKAVRAMLYPAARAAIRFNPAVGNLYARLRAKGKPDIVCVVACMRKLLHQVFACWVKGEMYDPQRWERDAVKAGEMSAKAKELQVLPKAAGKKSVEAPVSRREARKRKAADPVQFCGVAPQ
jgi:transposase